MQWKEFLNRTGKLSTPLSPKHSLENRTFGIKHGSIAQDNKTFTVVLTVVSLRARHGEVIKPGNMHDLLTHCHALGLRVDT